MIKLLKGIRMLDGMSFPQNCAKKMKLAGLLANT